MSDPPENAQSFAEAFSLEPAGEDRFVARFPSGFGGAALACATHAAGLSAPTKVLRALHAWFLRPLPTEAPVEVTVERVRDGQVLSHRRVVLGAEGRRFVELSASLSAPEGAGAIAWQEPRPGPEVPAPETLPNQFERLKSRHGVWREPIEWRTVGEPYDYGAGGERTAWDAWVRPTAPIPQGPGWHAAALAYLSDNHSDWSMAQRVQGYTRPRYATLDTAIWFHHPPLWDDWAMARSVSYVAHAGFSLYRRALYRRDGTLMATMAQEALYR